VAPELPKSTAYFDGACPLCQAEIGSHRRKDQVGGLCFVDISEAGAIPPEDPAMSNAAFPYSCKRWPCSFRRGGIRLGQVCGFKPSSAELSEVERAL
jgi:hypothetical protein